MPAWMRRDDRSRAAGHAGDPETERCLCGVDFTGKGFRYDAEVDLTREVDCTGCRRALGLEPLPEEERLGRRRAREG